MSELITMDKRDLIKAFRDYQKEWLYSHHDFELSPMLEEVFAKFLDDTAERFMVEKSQLLEEGTTKDATSDLISRKKALYVIRTLQTYKLFEGDDMILVDKADVQTELMMLPSAEGCKCPCEYREPCDVCHYDGHLGMGCPVEEGLKDE